ncbi:MAG: sulfite exporter TauE/SafE family protein [Desulfovibrionaceae bacterium]|nr:sulfite exporter TauE/SafE family protein [Desulfovibrionaceae bacterium]
MPDMISLIVFGAWFIAGFVSGVSGMGGAMVAVPIAALFIPMHEVIALSCLLCVTIAAGVALAHFRYCRVQALIPMLVGALPGAVAGLFILQLVSGEHLQGGVGLLLLGYIWWQHSYRAGTVHGESWQWGGIAGFGAGLLGTAISFDGPPVAAYGMYAGWQPRPFLGTLSVFFIVRSLLTCALQAYAGFYTPTVLGYALYGVPATLLGTLCAFPVAKRIPLVLFRQVLMLLIAVAGFVCLVRSLL